MAEKRMFSKQIIDSDAFLDMSLSTQALYFHYNGFIKLGRSIFEHWIFQDAEKFKAFVDLIQLARYRDTELLIGNDVIKVPRGSYYTSELKLAERWKWSRKKVRAYLNLLEKEKMVTKKGTTKGTMLTVENYDFYQGVGTTEGTTKEHQRNIKGTTKEHQRNNEGYTKEERKERKESKEGIRKNKNNNCSLFEQLGFGTINQYISKEIKHLENQYTEVWVSEALKEANNQGIRNMKYVKGILNNWKTKGYKKEKSKNTVKSDKFNNFSGRDYTDQEYASMEKKLLGWDE